MWAALALPWCFALVRPYYRTPRLLALLVVTTAVVIIASTLEETPRIGIQAAVALVWLVAFLAPERLRVGAMTSAERLVNEEIRRILPRDGFGAVAGGEIVEDPRLDALLPEVAAQDARWVQAVTLARASRARLPASLPRTWITLAAHHYQHDATGRRVIGRRALAGDWDYDVYLHVQHERSKLHGGAGADSIASELLATTPPHQDWVPVRDGLAELIRATDPIHPTTSARLQGRDDIARRLNEAWRIAQATIRPPDGNEDR